MLAAGPADHTDGLIGDAALAAVGQARQCTMAAAQARIKRMRVRRYMLANSRASYDTAL